MPWGQPGLRFLRIDSYLLPNNPSAFLSKCDLFPSNLTACSPKEMPALQIQSIRSPRWMSESPFFFFVVAEWDSDELIFPFISTHPLGPMLNSCHTRAARESTYGTHQPAFLIVLLPLDWLCHPNFGVLHFLGLRPLRDILEFGQLFALATPSWEPIGRQVPWWPQELVKIQVVSVQVEGREIFSLRSRCSPEGNKHPTCAFTPPASML